MTMSRHTWNPWMAHGVDSRGRRYSRRKKWTPWNAMVGAIKLTLFLVVVAALASTLLPGCSTSKDATDTGAVESGAQEAGIAEESSTTTGNPPAMTVPQKPEPVIAQSGDLLPKGNYEVELAGGDPRSTTRCIVSEMLACETWPTTWIDPRTGANASGLAVRFNPVRTKAVVGNLGDIDIHGVLPTGGVYTVGDITIDLRVPGALQFVKGDESAWMTRAAYGPTDVDFDAPGNNPGSSGD